MSGHQQLNMTAFNLQENDEAPALPSTLKLVNRANILRVFRDGQEHTVGDVSAQTGISKITTMRAVQFFCEKGVLVTRGKVYQNKSGGKYPEIFRLNVEKYILSITLWPGLICLTLTDFAGHIVQQTQNTAIDTHQEAIEKIEDVLIRELQAFLSSCAVDVELIYGVSVSTAGIIDYRNKRIRYNAQAPQWGKELDILGQIRGFFADDTYFFLENGAKCMARALLRRPEVWGKRALLITTTFGIGGCMIQDGRILNGRNSLIGEIGHMVVDAFDEELCSCGSHGCLERLTDLDRLRKKLQEMDIPQDSKLKSIKPEELTLSLLFALADEQDETARSLVGYLADCFAVALRNVSVAFDPDQVYFIGEYGNAGAYFDEQLKARLAEFCYYGSNPPFETFYEQITMLDMNREGAVVAVTDHYFRNPQIYE